MTASGRIWRTISVSSSSRKTWPLNSRVQHRPQRSQEKPTSRMIAMNSSSGNWRSRSRSASRAAICSSNVNVTRAPPLTPAVGAGDLLRCIWTPEGISPSADASHSSSRASNRYLPGLINIPGTVSPLLSPDTCPPVKGAGGRGAAGRWGAGEWMVMLHLHQPLPD